MNKKDLLLMIIESISTFLYLNLNWMVFKLLTEFNLELNQNFYELIGFIHLIALFCLLSSIHFITFPHMNPIITSLLYLFKFHSKNEVF